MQSGGLGISGVLTPQSGANLSMSCRHLHHIRMVPSSQRTKALISLFVPYCATQPPSMTSSLPVTNDASSEARYSTPYATSMASP